jgi:hypothetical protein
LPAGHLVYLQVSAFLLSYPFRRVRCFGIGRTFPG